MSRPFDRDIPRYPDEPGFPIEPTRDLPTAETSIFSDPSTAKSSELLTDYVSEASNSKTRASTIQNIISFCSIPEQQEAFARNLTSRMQNAEEIEGELSLRVTRYKEISEKLARHFETKTKTDTNSEEKGQVDDSQEDRYAILEPSTYQIPDKTISLVNECLKTTFLRDYGTTIPVLNKSDVLVVTDKSLKKFLHGLGRLETHPMRRIAGEELQRKMQRKESPFSQKESGLMVATDIAAPGAPILLPEVEIRSTAEYQEASQVEKRIVLEVVMGKTLLHESLHRVASFGEPIPVTPDSPLFRLAFASDRIGANYYTGKDERERKARLKMIGTLTNYASTHNPVVIIEGTRVKLLCDDDERGKKLITESGYDLEETIIEALTYRSMKPLVKHAQKEFPKDLADRTIKFVQDRFYTNDSYRHRNLLEEVMGYLDKLGLIGPSRALNALSQGSIPMLHIQKLPNEEYFV